MWSANDFLLYSGHEEHLGRPDGDGERDAHRAAERPGGDFFYILSSTRKLITETKTEHIAVSGRRSPSQADLVIKTVDFVDPATGVPCGTGCLARRRAWVITGRTRRRDAATSRSDLRLGRHQPVAAAGHARHPVAGGAGLQGTTVTIDVAFNLRGRPADANPFTTGNWFFFRLDSQGRFTTQRVHNNMIVAPAVW